MVVHRASLPSTMLGVGWTSSMALRARVLAVSARREGCSPVMAIVDVGVGVSLFMYIHT